MRHVFDALEPLRERGGAQGLTLHLAQYRTRLDERKRHALDQARHGLEDAKRIGHQGTASGPKLDDDHALGPAHALPHGGNPGADQFAEYLADLGRRDEIARAPDRLARQIIAGRAVGEARLHIIMHADGSFARDALFQPRRKRRRSRLAFQLRSHHAAKAGSRLARQMSHAPISIMGME